MKVYVVVERDIDVDSGLFDTQILYVCERLEKARDIFYTNISFARQTFQEYDYEEEQTDLSYVIWEKEFYASNHIALEIVEKEII